MTKLELGLSDLPVDLLRLIFECLSPVDLVRAGAVAKTWHDLSRSLLPYVLGKPRTPWLMSIPRTSSGAAVHMMNLEENKRSYIIRGLWQHFYDSQIVGCSNGWLVFLDENANPYLLNPFTKIQIHLPPIITLNSGFIQRDRVEHGDQFVVRWGTFRPMLSLRAVHKQMEQAIVTVNNENKVNRVFMRFSRYILYWRRGDEHWFSINREEGYAEPWYILFEENKLYALNSSWNVEMWDFSNDTPERKRHVINSGSHPEFSTRDMVTKVKYMVRARTGEFLVAVRFIRYYTNRNLVMERTESWELYKMRDRSQGEWERIQALEGYAVFLGENESIALLAEQVSGCKGDRIYYSNGHRTSEEDGQGYRERDVGVFDLQTKNFVRDIGRKDMVMSLWIVPNLSEEYT